MDVRAFSAAYFEQAVFAGFGERAEVKVCRVLVLHSPTADAPRLPEALRRRQHQPATAGEEDDDYSSEAGESQDDFFIWTGKVEDPSDRFTPGAPLWPVTMGA